MRTIFPLRDFILRMIAKKEERPLVGGRSVPIRSFCVQRAAIGTWAVLARRPAAGLGDADGISGDDHVDAAVLCAAGGGGVIRDGIVLAEALRRDVVLRNALCDTGSP